MGRTRNDIFKSQATDIPPNGIVAATYPLRGYPGQNDLGRPIAEAMLNGGESGLANQAWAYYRSVPELHFLVNYVANSMSQIRLFVGEVDASNPDNPVEIGPRHPARQLMREFAGGNQGQSELLRRLAIHLTVVGDSIIIGPSPTAGSLPQPYNSWRVYSTSEVSARGKKTYLRDPNMREQEVPKGVLPFRIWNPAPDYWWRADSPVYAAFGVLREISLLTAHINASSISRLKGAGITFIPEEFTLPGDEVETEGADADPFVRVLSEVMALAIKNPDSAAALVPIILRGPAEFGAAIKHFDFSTQFDSMVSELRGEAIRRLALAMDTPPEILLGSGGSTGWSMWQISEATLRMHVKPLAYLIAASLTEGWLKPSLAELPLADQTKESIPNLVVWPDFSQLRIDVDSAADNKDLYDRMEIAGDTLRHNLGLGDDEKPTGDELAYMILTSLVRTNPQLAPYAIDALRKPPFNVPLPDPSEAPALPSGGEETGTPPSPGTTSPPPKIPGERSKAKQTAAPSSPPADGDANNNVPGGA